ncbi:TPA: hypothetical protein GDO54_018670 [Pyxicephalus adspersus]|uniref:Uncharacterized protein n=1 Tax=Pyxicephalus adspersus TaxID=30357 RepID=A0AAV2ZF62_PYXAD|nr:TPA: hypothetical protein GDO54_018670 [Pyxicephalus adspersus]
MKLLSSADVRRLLHKKYVAILGDSIQRFVNKDLVKILQNDSFRTEKQLRATEKQLKGKRHDDSRYHDEQSVTANVQNQHGPPVFRLTEVLGPKCLLICNTSMSVGFKAGEWVHTRLHNTNVRWDIIEGNFYSTTLAYLHQLDVIDLHFHLRFKLRSRVKDATHSNQLAHRKYTCILMAHID